MSDEWFINPIDGTIAINTRHSYFLIKYENKESKNKESKFVFIS